MQFFTHVTHDENNQILELLRTTKICLGNPTFERRGGGGNRGLAKISRGFRGALIRECLVLEFLTQKHGMIVMKVKVEDLEGPQTSRCICFYHDRPSK